MTDDQIDDLKQFLTTTVANATADFATKDDLAGFATKDDLANLATKNDLANFATKDDIAKLATRDDLFAVRAELKQDIKELREEMHDGFAGIGESIETAFDQHDKLATRVTRLEQQAA